MHTQERSSSTLAVTVTSAVLFLTFFCIAGATDAALTPRERIARRDVASAVGITFGLLVFFAVCGFCWLSCMHPQWDPCACCSSSCISRISSGALYYASRGRWGHKPSHDDDDDVEMAMAQQRRQSIRLADGDANSEPYIAHPAMRVPSPHHAMRAPSPRQAMDRMAVSDDANTDADPRRSAHDRAVLEIVGHQRTGSGEAERHHEHERRHHRRARSQDATRELADGSLQANDAGRRSMDLLSAPAHARSRSEAIERWRQNVG